MPLFHRVEALLANTNAEQILSLPGSVPGSSESYQVTMN
jgi:hypothetical protein